MGEHTLVQPDLFVVPRSPGPLPDSWSEVGVPVLAVEVVSPSTARYDRRIKRELYCAAEVAEYWIADLDARLIERWSLVDERPEIARAVLCWTTPGTGREFVLDFATLFQRAPGERPRG